MVLFVVIAATVDQDVVLPVMQVMCSTAAIVVHFLSYVALCIGYVEELFRLLILQLTHPVPQFLHHLIQLLILQLTYLLILQLTHHLILQFFLPTLQLTHHPILQLTHHPIIQLTHHLILQLLHPVLQFIHHFIHPVLRLTHHLVLLPLRLHPMVKGHVLLDGYNSEESVICLVQHIQRQTRIMVRSTILSVPSLHALATPSP